MYYDLEAMEICSNNLNDILNGGISEKTLNDFQEVAFSLEWQGIAANSFRNEVTTTVSLLRDDLSNQMLIEKIRNLANFPKEKAYQMQVADQSMALHIKALFGI